MYIFFNYILGMNPFYNLKSLLNYYKYTYCYHYLEIKANHSKANLSANKANKRAIQDKNNNDTT